MEGSDLMVSTGWVTVSVGVVVLVSPELPQDAAASATMVRAAKKYFICFMVLLILNF